MSSASHVCIDNPDERLICGRCQIPLVSKRVNLTYMSNRFPVDLPTCPKCALVYMPEDLATGRIHDVEQALEDK